MPTLRPFRALRFDTAVVDLARVLAPPYDIISPDERLELLARDPHNIVRIELPADVGDAGPADYAAAARTAAAWREAGTLVKDADPSVTVHQMLWTTDAGEPAQATGLLCRLRLEEYGPGAGVLPHEKTHGGPKADRYALLEATRLNTSPLVFLAGADPVASSRTLLALADRPADVEAETPDGVRHRLWIVAADEAAAVLEVLASAPLTIADGHHRYETALRYRAHRRAEGDPGDSGGAGAAGDDPAWDYLLALVYPLDQSPPALPTHRVVRGQPCGEDLLARLAPFAAIEPLPHREALLERMAEPARLLAGVSGSGRIGILTGSGPSAALLTVDRAAVDARLEPGLSDASRGLDVNALGVLIGEAYGAGAAELAAEGRLWYVKDAAEATWMVVEKAASAAFLLDPMPPAAITSVAAAREVMPQKSTYFHPKAPTGLVLSPLEW